MSEALMRRDEGRHAGSVLQICLDPAVPWEALLARHLEGLPSARRQDRARELLVAGFREACWVRGQLAERRSSRWRARPETSVCAERTSKTPGEGAAVSEASVGPRPLTALAKVIG